MFDPRIRIKRSLYELIKQQAAEKGFSSPEEFITHLLESAVSDMDPGTSEEEIRERLKGLGYL